jgi:hypothetical protein
MVYVARNDRITVEDELKGMQKEVIELTVFLIRSCFFRLNFGEILNTFKET